MITVVLVDDHPMFREGLRLGLESVSDISVVGEAGTMSEAVDVVAVQRPDVVVMDLNLPGGSGIEATKQILTDNTPTPRPEAAGGPGALRRPAVLVLTMGAGNDVILAALRAGARGFLLKDSSASDAVNAVRVVADGGALLGPTVAARITQLLADPLKDAGLASFPSLAPRERDVLRLLGQGQTNREIAKELHLAEKTVRNHVSAIFAKLEVRDRTAAALRAREAGL
ncbi:response regulator transcription factor [Streptomyces noursei]|uniref:response regulator transcription factor n=1 Tax=Streptomyces noursei TaxID=1971 RepID=UPI0030F31959